MKTSYLIHKIIVGALKYKFERKDCASQKEPFHSFA